MSVGRRLTLVVLAAVCGTFLLSGCAPDREAEPDSSSQLAIYQPKVDPLLAFVQPAEILVVLEQAEDILAYECMARFGFKDFPVKDYDRLAMKATQPDERIYGITNRAVAAKYGYLLGPAVAPPAATSESGTVSYRNTLFGDFEALAQGRAVEPEPGGIPIGGCLGEAQTKLTGNPNGVPTMDAEGPRSLIPEAWLQSWDDARTVAAKADWSRCMAAVGYTVKDPVMDEYHFPNRGPDEGAPGDPAEIQQALADITCKEETDFVSRVNAVHIEYSNRLIEENQLVLNEWKTFYAEALVKANEVIANGN